MKVKVTDLNNKSVGEIELNDEIFGLPVRGDLLHRMVGYQLNKRRAGTHKTKGVSEISGTTKKPHKQKGTGRARQGFFAVAAIPWRRADFWSGGSQPCNGSSQKSP